MKFISELHKTTKDIIMNRVLITAAAAAGLLIAVLPPAVGAAASGAAAGCAQWEFNGVIGVSTPEGEISSLGGGTGPSLQNVQAMMTFLPKLVIYPGGGAGTTGGQTTPPPAVGVLSGAIGSDGAITLGFSAGAASLQMQGHVNPDGSAHGTTSGGNWSLSHLTCMKPSA